MTREPDIYREPFQTTFRGDDKKIQIFGVPIGHAKITRNVQFNLAAPVMKYQQKLSYSCCLISLAT